MKRVVAMVIAVCFLSASPAFAQLAQQAQQSQQAQQTQKTEGTQNVKARPDFSPNAAGLTKNDVLHTAFGLPTKAPQNSKPWYKNPWIMGSLVAVIVIILVVALSDSYDDTTDPYQTLNGALSSKAR